MSLHSPPVGSLPRRERLAILSGLIGVSALSWVYLIHMALGMGNMDSISADAVLRIRPWTAADFLFMFLMWAIMMVGMMVPTAIPMTLIYAAIARKAQRQNTTLAPAAVFITGYVAIWSLFSIGATLTQWALDQAALLSPMMVSNSPLLGAALLIGAGIYQMTPAKDACLKHCRSPAHFISQHWRASTFGAFQMGLEHGCYCLGCCWILMGLLFFGGVMNLLWIGGITLFVLLEKVLPFGALGGRLAGVACIVIGLALLLSLWWEEKLCPPSLIFSEMPQPAGLILRSPLTDVLSKVIVTRGQPRPTLDRTLCARSDAQVLRGS